MCAASIQPQYLLMRLFIAKRAETRKCPICDELIPLRLLAAHGVLESQRVEEIIKQVGSTDVLFDEPDDRYASYPTPVRMQIE